MLKIILKIMKSYKCVISLCQCRAFPYQSLCLFEGMMHSLQLSSLQVQPSQTPLGSAQVDALGGVGRV